MKTIRIMPSNNDQIINPKTGNLIKIGGQVYKKLLTDGLIEPPLVGPPALQGAQLMASALRGYSKSYNVDITDSHSVIKQLSETSETVKNVLGRELHVMNGIKPLINLKVQFKKLKKDEGFIMKTGYFNSAAVPITNQNQISQIVSEQNARLIYKVDQWLSEGSGWIIDSVDGHWINISKYKPLRGASYIPTPAKLRQPS